MHKEGLTIPQLGQVWVNIDHLAESITELEKFVAVVTKYVSPSLARHSSLTTAALVCPMMTCTLSAHRTDSEGVTAVRLYGGSTFKVNLLAVIASV